MKRLNQQILDSGLQKKWIAEKLGISAPTLSMYLKEKREMPKHIELQILRLIK